MNDLVTILLTVVGTVGFMSMGFAIYNSRKSGSKEIPWDKIRPILSEMFIQVQNISEANKGGYEALEEYAVTYVAKKVQNATFLVAEEKALLTKDFIRAIIAPRLRELYLK